MQMRLMQIRAKLPCVAWSVVNCRVVIDQVRADRRRVSVLQWRKVQVSRLKSRCQTRTAGPAESIEATNKSCRDCSDRNGSTA